jgi:5-hydroxyisourate hydrolase-like protein (transthyretin family)
MTFMRHVVCTGLFALLLSVSAVAAPPMSQVTVHVISAETGKPIDRAAVVIRFVKGRAPMKLYRKMLTTWETQTNQEGNTTLPTIPQGEIRVQVIAKNFQTFGDTVDINQDAQTVEIKLNPPQAQYSTHEGNPRGEKK